MTEHKKQRLNLRLTDEEKKIIRDAATITNQSISRFIVHSAFMCATEIIDQHHNRILSAESWSLIMDAISNPPAPNS